MKLIISGSYFKYLEMGREQSLGRVGSMKECQQFLCSCPVPTRLMGLLSSAHQPSLEIRRVHISRFANTHSSPLFSGKKRYILLIGSKIPERFLFDFRINLTLSSYLYIVITINEFSLIRIKTIFLKVRHTFQNSNYFKKEQN